MAGSHHAAQTPVRGALTGWVYAARAGIQMAHALRQAKRYPRSLGRVFTFKGGGHSVHRGGHNESVGY